jgi:hypothetical protein
MLQYYDITVEPQYLQKGPGQNKFPVIESILL